MQPFQGIDDLVNVLGSTGGREDGASEGMNVGHHFRGQVHQGMAIFGDKALKTVTDPVNMPDPVNVMQLQNDGPDDVVGPGTQSPAGGDGAMDFGWIEINLGPGSGLFTVERHLSRPQAV